MIGVIVAQLVGLFVDDGFLAAAILAGIAVASALMLADAPAWAVGLVLALICRRPSPPASCSAQDLRAGKDAADPSGTQGETNGSTLHRYFGAVAERRPRRPASAGWTRAVAIVEL